MTLDFYTYGEISPERARPLLEACHLPLDGLEGTKLWATSRGDQLLTIAGLETYGDVVLLRSVATEEASRGKGKARVLCALLLHEAKSLGARQAFLLTESAEGFFAKLGFTTIPREEADPRLLAAPAPSS